MIETLNSDLLTLLLDSERFLTTATLVSRSRPGSSLDPDLDLAWFLSPPGWGALVSSLPGALA